MSPHIKRKAPLTLAVLFFLITVCVIWYYLVKPWPGVYSSDEWSLVNPPPRNTYTANQPITWSKPTVCVPEGTTTVQIFMRAPTDTGTFDALVYTRIITNETAGYCRSPNYTTIAVPDWLPGGKYQIVLRACTDTPNPRDTCVEVDGPTFILHGATF